MKSIDLMVFDLDGTLIRSGEDQAAAVNHTLKSLGLSSIDPLKIQEFIGDGVQMLMRRSLGPRVEEYFEQAMPIFSSYYADHLVDRTDLYPGVLTVLDHFSDKRKFMVTKKMERFTLKIAKGLGIDSRFNEIITIDNTPYKKPDPRLLYHVMAKWGVTPGRTVVIGDGINYLLMAKQAGVLSCACLGGLTEREKLLALAPDLTCETLEDLKTLLC
jgi:phosphoglycolate phosphatase